MRIFQFAAAAAGASAAYMLWQLQELMRFNKTRYTVHSDKLKETHRFVVLSDLHLWRYGKIGRASCRERV